MAAPAKRIEISGEDRRELERIVRSRTAERRALERARIVLAAAEGRSATRIAAEVDCSERTVLPGCAMRPGRVGRWCTARGYGRG